LRLKQAVPAAADVELIVERVDRARVRWAVAMSSRSTVVCVTVW